jgi:hypothetical protein
MKAQSTWTKADTAKAREIRDSYKKSHDLALQAGQTFQTAL